MKKILFLIPLAALCFSCAKENDAADADSAIRFSAEAAAPETKVSYSGEDTAGKERLEWSLGDRFSVWCPESAVTKVASYSVSGPADYIDNTGATSTASKVGAVDANNVLEWGGAQTTLFTPATRIPLGLKALLPTPPILARPLTATNSLASYLRTRLPQRTAIPSPTFRRCNTAT